MKLCYTFLQPLVVLICLSNRLFQLFNPRSEGILKLNLQPRGNLLALLFKHLLKTRLKFTSKSLFNILCDRGFKFFTQLCLQMTQLDISLLLKLLSIFRQGRHQLIKLGLPRFELAKYLLILFCDLVYEAQLAFNVSHLMLKFRCSLISVDVTLLLIYLIDSFE